MNFAYQARDSAGGLRDGRLNAISLAEAVHMLRQEGLYPVTVQEAGVEAPAAPKLELFKPRVPRSEIIYFTSQLAIMIEAGVPVATALESLVTQTGNATFRNVLANIHRTVEAGDPFSTALGRFPKHFDRTFVNLIRASEASGTLARMLDRIAAELRNELELRQKVRGALMYPGMMLLMCISVSAFLLMFVFPKLTPMFAMRKMNLPKPTLVMMTISDVLVNHTLLVGAAVLVVGGSAYWAARQQWGKRAIHWLMLYTPIMGPAMRKVAISRCLRTLATTINAGVPMLEAIKLSASVSNNVLYERCWLSVADQVATGKQINEALEGNRLIPSTLVQMIASGEASGKLGHVLHKVSDYYDRDVENSIKTVTSLIEPLMVFVMGGVIGTIAMAMLLPIFKLSSPSGH